MDAISKPASATCSVAAPRLVFGQLHQSFDRIHGEARGGRRWRRRFRSCCLQLLEHLQYLIQLLVHQTWPRTSRSVLRRAGQIQDRLDQIRDGYTPERNQPLLERLERERGSSDEDSAAAETVVVTSDSEIEAPRERTEIQGVWQSGRYTSVRITAANPLLRSRSSASASSANPVSSASASSANPVNLPWGAEIRPAISQKIQSQYVLALDWHQCLDVCRTWNGTLRPVGYRILDIFQEKIAELRRIFPDLCVIILSYCHAPEFRRGVLSVPESCIDFRVVTDKKIGPLGKLAALKAIFIQRGYRGCSRGRQRRSLVGILGTSTTSCCSKVSAHSAFWYPGSKQRTSSSSDQVPRSAILEERC